VFSGNRLDMEGSGGKSGGISDVTSRVRVRACGGTGSSAMAVSHVEWW
jgi:hypothetical protein